MQALGELLQALETEIIGDPLAETVNDAPAACLPEALAKDVKFVLTVAPIVVCDSGPRTAK